MPNDNQPRHNEFSDIAGESGGDPHPSDHASQAVEDLSERLQAEQDARKEERFMFVLAGLVFLNIHTFASSSTWTTPIVIGLLQLIGLAIYARRCGVEEVEKLIDKFLSAVPGRDK
ncbi:hypothetical protein NPJ88_020380 [Halomonas elongata]|uniref:hypothetical protein n=1 Tax=Halomonas elongata TaxID=2746 RepID=UPI00255A8C70|nr:hypothetical protein [Halomonas elongata]MDL4864690.1 hypothetical protein [Halomonas elongata]